MKTIHLMAFRSFRILLATAALASGLFAGCETVDSNNDMTVYPTAAEKNLRMQEQMSQMTRALQ